MARRTANELLDRHGIDKYPVQPDWLAAQEEVEVVEQSGFPIHCFGAFSLEGGKPRIFVSDACPSRGLRRFTLGHELGHALIDGHTERLVWTGAFALSEGHFRGSKDPVEVEADHFASELLLPTRWAKPFVEAATPGVASIRNLAQQFDTSLPCAAVRFTNLSPEPVIIVLSNGLSIEWVTRSEPFEGVPWIRLRGVKGEWAPPGCATRHLADRREDIVAGAERTGMSYLCEWFPGAPKDLLVDEEAVGLGTYGRVLTVLYCPEIPDADELYEQDSMENSPQDWRDALRGYHLG